MNNFSLHRILLTIVVATLTLVAASYDAVAQETPSDLSDNASVDAKIESLLEQMTVEEKIGQMTLYTSFWSLTGPSEATDSLENDIRTGDCGNVFNAVTPSYVRRLQTIACEETRLGIPLLFGYDVIHGYKTIFPICLGESASWNLELMEQSARIAAVEASSSGVNWTFAPMVDVARDPRWGRVSEGAGEDTYLGSQIARARVRGFQSDDLSNNSTILACPKHFAAYGAAQSGRDYHTVDISERTLRDTYLPPFRAAIDEGALSIMTAFNELNGIPATANDFLLEDILRDEWGFEGFVVTDYTSINEMVFHGFSEDDAHAGVQSANAGVDMDMQGGVFSRFLKESLEEGLVSEDRIDDAVRNVLRLKHALGLFDDPYLYCPVSGEDPSGSSTHLEVAYESACQSLVLLQNRDNVLPLQRGLDIAVVGPLAKAQRDLIGSWSGRGEWDEIETVLGRIEASNIGGTVAFSPGCDIDSDDRTGFDAAVQAAQDADVVVLVLGESWEMSGEAACRTNINLPGVQTDLLRAIKETGKPIVLVLMNGRPLALEEEIRLADAILEAWFPGTEGARAIVDTLFGFQNPCGKLPISFPRNVGQVPLFYGMKNTGRPVNPESPDEKYKSRYLDCSNDPLFPFGFGLSYTSFSYSNPCLDRTEIGPNESLTASVTVTNEGDRDGVDVLQLYIRDLVGDVTRPVMELKSFDRIELQAGESRRIEFTIGEQELRFLRRDMTWGTEPGLFHAYIGPDSRNLQSAEFRLVE
jgi:beta-glucosidase